MAGAWPLTRWLATVLAAGMLLVTSTPAVAAEITIAPTTARIPADADQATVWLYNQAGKPWRAEAKLYRWRQDGEREVLEPPSPPPSAPASSKFPARAASCCG